MANHTHLISDKAISYTHLTPRWWKVFDKPSVVISEIKEKQPVDYGGTVQPKHVPQPRYHHVSVTGTTEFHDYETFGSDEHGTFGYRQETTLSTSDLGATLLTWRKGFGGEERVELDIDGSLRPDGTLAVNIQTRFYEGATEGTTELEDSRVFQALVPVGQTSNFNVHLRNDEDDWATIRGSIGNQLL